MIRLKQLAAAWRGWFLEEGIAALTIAAMLAYCIFLSLTTLAEVACGPAAHPAPSYRTAVTDGYLLTSATDAVPWQASRADHGLFVLEDNR